MRFRAIHLLTCLRHELIGWLAKVDPVVGGNTPLDLAVECGYQNLAVALLSHAAHPSGTLEKHWCSFRFASEIAPEVQTSQQLRFCMWHRRKPAFAATLRSERDGGQH